LAAQAIRPPGVSGNGNDMAAGLATAIRRDTETGAATVTKPAPLLKQARVAMMAAPLNSGEPAINSTRP
jgi:hypothetical protein